MIFLWDRNIWLKNGVVVPAESHFYTVYLDIAPKCVSFFFQRANKSSPHLVEPIEKVLSSKHLCLPTSFSFSIHTVSSLHSFVIHSSWNFTSPSLAGVYLSRWMLFYTSSALSSFFRKFTTLPAFFFSGSSFYCTIPFLVLLSTRKDLNCAPKSSFISADNCHEVLNYLL